MDFSRTLVGIPAGIVSTFVMDGFAILMGVSGMIRLQGHAAVPVLLGRWILGVPRSGALIRDLKNCAPIQGEIKACWTAHYLIGAMLGLFYGSLGETGWRAGAVFGAVTCLLPWLVLFPAVGFGLFGNRTPVQTSLLVASTSNHLVYGAALGLLTDGLRF